MREVLKLPEGLHGRVWAYQSSRAPHPKHRHEEIELNFVTRGACSYLVNDRRYEMRRHSLLWLFPAQEHVLLRESPDFVMWILVFKPAPLRHLCMTPETQPLLEPSPQGVFCKRLAAHQAQRLTELLEEMQNSENDAARFNAGLGYALLSAWSAFRETEAAEAGRDVHPAVEKAAHLLRRENHANMTLDELAKSVGLSPARLSRLFKQQTGVPLSRFRNRQRIERFLSLREHNLDATLLHLALEAGFGSYAQFHRVFKEVLNCSPAEYYRHMMP